MVSWLVGQFDNRRFFKNQTNKTSSWEYTICPLFSYLDEGVKVCKMTYMAIMDIRDHQINQAQRKIREGIRQESLIDKDIGLSEDVKNKDLTLEKIFDAFEIDHEYYMNNLQCFVNFACVPNSVSGLIATAFFVDFFQICGEMEV